MFCTLSHGTSVSSQDAYGADACTDFDYYFPNAKTPKYDGATLKALTELHKAMVDQSDPSGNHSTLPPVITYFGQFIDHDITGQHTNNPRVDDIFGDDVSPLKRDDVSRGLNNLRTGRLDLDSLYGSGRLRTGV